MTRLGDWLMYRVHGKTVHPRKTRRTRARRGPARNWKYRAWIRTLPCLVCGREPSEAAHTGSEGGLQLKASDYSCVPICMQCHTMAPDSYHRLGRVGFEAVHQVDCRELVRRLNHDWFAYSREVK